jgi:hypothetical protein
MLVMLAMLEHLVLVGLVVVEVEVKHPSMKIHVDQLGY